VRYFVAIRAKAAKDLARAQRWYEKREGGLGDRLIDEAYHAIRILQADADRFALYHGVFRRIQLERFPYKIFFVIEGSDVIVFRVLHAKQHHKSRLPRRSSPP